VPDSNPDYAHMLTDMLPILWRRRWLIFVTLVLTSAAGLLFYDTFGERYESYTLLRVGQGIKDRSTSGPFGDGPDLTGRIESLARIAATDQVIRLAASQIGSDRLFKKSSIFCKRCQRSSIFSNRDLARMRRTAWMHSGIKC
jgi:succinoglycan biosynthesis transport protein ExoP